MVLQWSGILSLYTLILVYTLVLGAYLDKNLLFPPLVMPFLLYPKLQHYTSLGTSLGI